jgi:hypothetical protein
VIKEEYFIKRLLSFNNKLKKQKHKFILKNLMITKEILLIYKKKEI